LARSIASLIPTPNLRRILPLSGLANRRKQPERYMTWGNLLKIVLKQLTTQSKNDIFINIALQ
jgi:hypothetical protein